MKNGYGMELVKQIQLKFIITHHSSHLILIIVVKTIFGDKGFISVKMLNMYMKNFPIKMK